MALGWPSDPWNNRYLGASQGGDNSAAAGAVNNRVGGINIWPVNYSGQQNRPGVVSQINTLDTGTGETNRRINTQDTSSAGTPPAQFGANVNRNPANGFAGPVYSASAPPGTPPPAPTAAQVAANPMDYAGTSFDPALSAQFRPPTGLANSTTQDTRDSNGDVIKGFQPWKMGPGILDPYDKPTTDLQGNRIDLNANQGNADALLRMYPELQALGWGGTNRRNMGDWLGDQRTTNWLYSNPAYGLTDTPQRRAVTEAFRSNPLFSTAQDNVTPQNYQQIVAALDAIDPRIAQYWGPRAIYS